MPKVRLISDTLSTCKFSPYFVAALLLFLLSGLTACASRSLPIEVEIAASRATVDWMKERYGFLESAEITGLIDRTVERLSQVVYAQALEREIGDGKTKYYVNYPWDVYVLDTPEPGAFSAGAGAIFISKGLILRLDSESELAAVLSHEMSHIILGHTREAIRRSGLTSSPQPGFSFLLSEELAADSLSAKMLKVARYDPRQALNALTLSYRHFRDPGSLVPPEWLALRYTNLYREVNALQPYFSARVNSREFNRVRERLARP